MDRARGGRVRASPPFCESITRSRWVGSCYSGASTPSPAGPLCVQWTGESCLSTLPAALLALQPSLRRRLGLLGATARLPPRPMPTGVFGLPPSPRPREWREAAGGARRPMCPGSGVCRAQPFPPPCPFPVSPWPVPNAWGGCAVFPDSPQVLALKRCFSGTPVSPPAPRIPIACPVWPFPLPVGLPLARAQFFTLRRPWCACAAFPAARTLRSAYPSRGSLGRGQENAALLPGRVRALLRPRPAPPGSTHKEWSRTQSNSSKCCPGVSGWDSCAPFVTDYLGASVCSSSTSCPHPPAWNSQALDFVE